MGTLPECGIRTTALFSVLSVGEELSALTDPLRSPQACVQYLRSCCSTAA